MTTVKHIYFSYGDHWLRNGFLRVVEMQTKDDKICFLDFCPSTFSMSLNDFKEAFDV